MRPLWFTTHAVVDRMEADPEFARFVHLSEEEFKDMDFSEYGEDEPIDIVYRHIGDPDWTIRIVASWDRSRTTICFPWEEIEEETE